MPETQITRPPRVIVVGAGLCGLAAAFLLKEAGLEVKVLEARPRAGGRVHSAWTEDDRYCGDLGPTWIWPSFQPLLARWVTKLQLDTCEQFVEGDALYEIGSHRTVVKRATMGQEGQRRLSGGTSSIIRALQQRLPSDAVQCGTVVTSVRQGKNEVILHSEAGEIFNASGVIIALPPRIAMHSLSFHPALQGELTNALTNTPTWMATHAKFVALYDNAFWRERDLSGRIASQTGAIAEGHDHCGDAGIPAALTGFIGWPTQMRAQHGSEAVIEAVRAQLGRFFGTEAPQPTRVYLTDWSQERFTSTPLDSRGPVAHPSIAPNTVRLPYWNGRLFFSGAETARVSPGLLEGALAAAEHAAEQALLGVAQR